MVSLNREKELEIVRVFLNKDLLRTMLVSQTDLFVDKRHTVLTHQPRELSCRPQVACVPGADWLCHFRFLSSAMIREHLKR